VTTDEDAIKLINDRARYQSHLVNTNSVKVVADGTFLSFSSLMLEPYTNNPKTFGETAIGINAKAQEQLLAFHKAGMQLHFHAHGDGTIHEVLNILERFQKEYPRPGLHHHIAHNSVVDDKDISRFRELGVVADFSPPLYFPSDYSPMMDAIFGEERLQTKWYPIKKFIDAGVVTAFATDWPLAFPSPSPWPYMEAMVTRKDPYGKFPGQLGQPITLAQAIKVFTLAGAQVVMQENDNGSIEVGKYADMIVLDRNLFDIPVDNIDSTKVLYTVFEGKVVYSAPMPTQ
jgi:predicted amidohydrolase YtcJ